MSRILVIEDDPQVIDNVIDILELEDHDLLTAENGFVGIQTALEQQPELIICDVMMPQMNGYEVLRVLRSETATKTTPFIFLTAKADRSDQRFGMELGADDYLTKPFTPRELLQAIATRLAKQAAVAQEYNSQIQVIEDKLQQQLYSDPITNLPNRLTLGDRFTDAVQNYYQQADRRLLLGLVTLCIDRFSTIRNHLDYQQVDRLLQAFAKQLHQWFPQEYIAQISADEFVIIFRPVQRKNNLIQAIQNFRSALESPLQVDDHKIFLSISAGLTLYPRDGRTLAALLHNAQTAIAQVQKQGGNGQEFYSAMLSRGKTATLSLEAELREAIAKQQFQVYYQPKVNLDTKTIESCEALMRWNHPKQGILAPSRFLPLAQETGLIDSIGEFVLEQACSQVKRWQQELNRPLSVAVNVSNRQFNQVDLRQRVLKILVDTGLLPEYLELELTENFLVQDIIVAKRRMDSFRHLGIKIAIDDFGTGYSSLKYLQQFAFDTLKIDRCFVQNIHSNPGNAVITQATIEMAHQLNIKVVAEGVETLAELDYLHNCHCDIIQGYYFSPPLPADQFVDFLTQNQMLLL